ncbi:hypothetical protein [Corynebacterium aquatimens]|uniref:Uncharacterized protein n=1 Tax=Corynebacterium aquatimens TaxID=1190508 RepID=A0A931DZI9_9CORY|nr:hypothetical protein [Corynebacterium aquatimens]MBG6121939.1 hypothetical protein [Corynebacterium aquatimens]WJY65523.1 hypothetical protein CAQUA_04050 [Corynebacterium aquatimens]
MTLQPRPGNPIEARKQAVRKYSRNAVLWAGGGILGGVAVGLLTSVGLVTALVLGLIVAVVGGGYNYNKVQQIINHQDPQ